MNYRAIVSVICNNDEGELELYMSNRLGSSFVRSIGTALIFEDEIEAYNNITWQFIGLAHWMINLSDYPVLGLYIVWIDDNKRIVGRIRYI